MHALHLKLLRELRRLWAQVLAIALVMAAGVATLVIGVGTYQSLAQTRQVYYEANRFADLFANATRAPRSLLQRIASIDGVLAVDGRISKLALVDIATLSQPASALLVSLPGDGDGGLNRLYLRNGRLPEAGHATEALVSEIFARANGFVPGSHVKVVMNGVLRDVTITGVALSPQYIYAMAPGEMMPNEARFGVLWMPDATLAAAYDLQGAFNDVSLKLLAGADTPAVISALDHLLEPYGGQGAYGRSLQTSNAFLDSELMQLRSMSSVLPPVFLLVAAFLVNMTLTRLIALEREQIGLLKALGYSSWAIAWHYVEFVLLIAIIGTAIGYAFGIWAGNALTVLYARFYSFPILVFSRDPLLYAVAGAITMGAAVIGAVRAVRQAAWLPPAVAMTPPSPPTYRRALGGRLSFLPDLRETSIMVSRHLLHWPWRTLGGITGVAFSVAILVGSLWSFGAMEFMIDYTFNRTDRQDASLSFLGPQPMEALYEVGRLPGVFTAEPFRSVGVEISNGNYSRRIAITGRPAGTELSRLLDARSLPVVLPETGIVLSRPLAELLHARAGDDVTIRLLEGERRTRRVRISGIVESYFGLAGTMRLDALRALTGEGEMISGANVDFDPNAEAELFATFKRTPSLGHISLRSVALHRFRETMAQNTFVMIGVLVALAGLIAFGVVYNFARISLSEQGREMASLRVLGFTRREVSLLLLVEIAVVTLLAQPLGWLLGYGIAFGMVKGFSSELFSMPFVLTPAVYAQASLVVAAAALFSGLVVRRRIDRLDMIAVLKTRE
jgi:putative ABC transport system permease protein